jgi:hypothetical protein
VGAGEEVVMWEWRKLHNKWLDNSIALVIELRTWAGYVLRMTENISRPWPIYKIVITNLKQKGAFEKPERITIKIDLRKIH